MSIDQQSVSEVPRERVKILAWGSLFGALVAAVACAVFAVYGFPLLGRHWWSVLVFLGYALIIMAVTRWCTWSIRYIKEDSAQ
jgi:hypothetical protein